MPWICAAASSRPIRIADYLGRMITARTIRPRTSDVTGFIGDLCFSGDDSSIELPNELASFGAVRIGGGPMFGRLLMDAPTCRSDLLELSRVFLTERLLAPGPDAPLFGAAINSCGNGMIAGRDALGTRPFFVTRNADITAVCTEPGAVSALGIGPPGRFPPSRVMELNTARQVDLPVAPKGCRPDPASTPVVDLIACLKRAIRALPTPRAVLFSGGIDSLLLAKISEQEGDTVCITAGLKGCKDLARAQRASSNLSSPLETVEIAPGRIPKEVAFISEVMRAENALNVSIALPLLHASTKAHELGIHTAICGQGADELFGGYKRYLSDPAPEQSMLRDLLQLHARGLETCTLAVRSAGVELFLPYLDEDVVRLALSLPLEMKIRNGQRKVLLRDAGLELGLAEGDVFAEKCAIQYGSGVSRHVLGLLRRSCHATSKT